MTSMILNTYRFRMFNSFSPTEDEHFKKSPEDILKEFRLEVLKEAADLAILEVAGTSMGDYTDGHDAARQQIYDKLIREAGGK